MAREINLTDIGDHFEKKVSDTVRKATFKAEADIKFFTPVDTGRLIGSWEREIKPFVGVVFTDVEYAEPVAYGTNLPPSWGGRYRTRPETNTIKGYPELVAKQLERFIRDEFRRS
tara:strand:+ start:743 stop:1087 length:345 start_codon:yes stop_codon:yes gene_type:complete